MIISIDIGGTYTRVASIEENKIVKFKTTSFNETFEKICQTICDLANGQEITKIGISLCGPIDYKNHRLITSNNLSPEWKNFSIMDKFQEQFPQAIIKYDNDVNVAALGQYIALEQMTQSLLYITFSTGIGGGLILNNQIYRGFTGTAFEIANSIPDYNYHKNGYKSGVEYFAGGNGLIKQAYLHGLVINETKELFDLYYQNDIIAMKILTEAENKIASMLSTAIYMVNPEMIVIGGSVALNNKDWFQKIIDKVLLTTKDIGYETVIIFAKDLDKATLIGCAEL